MEAIKIDSASQTIVSIEVDDMNLATAISKDCKTAKAFLLLYLTDKNSRQRKYILYASESAARIPFNTGNLDFFCFGNLILQGNGLVIQDYTEKGEGIIDTPITSIYRTAELSSFVQSSVTWPSFEAVAHYIAKSFDPLSEDIYLEIVNQKYPIIKQLDKLEELCAETSHSEALQSEIGNLRSEIEKFHKLNIEQLTRFRKLSENYNFYRNRRPKQ